MTRKERLRHRNIKVRKFINEFGAKNPQWKRYAIIQEAAGHFYVSERTIEAILTREGAYAD